MGGCSNSSGNDCTPDNHCYRADDGNYSCEFGYIWEDVEDPNNFKCVKANDGEVVSGDSDCPNGSENCKCTSSGECDSGLNCNAYNICVCEPDCEDKECGDNGCGGICGSCSDYYTCIQGACVYQPWCGDGECDLSRNENCSSCPNDCPCLCGEQCLGASCVFTACDGKDCGPDGCGSICGTCTGGDVCENYQCIDPCASETCGDGNCNAACDETISSCCSDCAVCGDETCSSCETISSCPVDCSSDIIVSSVTCTPDPVMEGSSISCSVVVTNQGGMAAGWFMNDLRLSTNTTINTSDMPLGNRSVTSLGAGLSTTIISGGMIPAGSSNPFVGTSFIGVIADSNNNVSEYNESNNTNYVQVTVLACTPNCPVCRTSSVSDGCGGTCAANCSTSCSGDTCISCAESWSCTPWSTCSCANEQTRTCTDSNDCGTEVNRPTESQYCAHCGDSICDSGCEDTINCCVDCAVCGDEACSSCEIASGCPVDCCSKDSYEDNDTIATAFSIGNGSYSGLSACPSDDDYYEVTLSAGGQIQVDIFFFDAEGDIDLYLLDSTGNIITFSNTATDNEGVAYISSLSGAFYIYVSLYLDAGSVAGNSYDMDITTSGTPGGLCTNPHDLSGETFPFQLTGSFNDDPADGFSCDGTPTNVVWYEYSAAVTGTHTIDVDNGSSTDAGSRLVVLGGLACNPYDAELSCVTNNAGNVTTTADFVAGSTYLIAFFTDGDIYTMVDPTILISNASPPDLLPTQFSSDAPTYNPGDTVIVTYARANQGGSDSGTFREGYYLSTDDCISTTDDTLLKSANRGSLAPGVTVGPFSLPLTIPAGTGAGTYWLGYFVDDLNEVVETNESNNTLVVPILVDPGCACGDWADGVCGEGVCTNTQRQQTRTCSPSGCYIESQCVSDASCGCTSHDSYSCYFGDVYWYDSCGTREGIKENCSCEGCTGAACIPPTSHASYQCYDSDVYWYDSCGSLEDKKQECGTSGYSGSNYCSNNDVYRDWVNRGCSGNTCNSVYESIKQEECGADGCSGGACVTCTSHDSYSCYDSDVYWYDSCGSLEDKKQECGTSGYSGNNYCSNNDVYRDWVDRGCSGSSCFSNTVQQKQQECGLDGCHSATCNVCPADIAGGSALSALSVPSSVDECDDPYGYYDETICPANDEDWFIANVNDTSGICIVEPKIWLYNLPANYDLCVYFTCNGVLSAYSGDVTCTEGSHVSHNLGFVHDITGVAYEVEGCCSTNTGTLTETVEFDVNCTSDPSEDGHLYMKIYPASSAEASDQAYTLDYQY